MNVKGYTNLTNSVKKDNEIFIFALFGMSYGLAVCVVCLLTIHVLLKCTQLTRQIRLMSIHMTANNLAFGILFSHRNDISFLQWWIRL